MTTKGRNGRNYSIPIVKAEIKVRQQRRQHRFISELLKWGFRRYRKSDSPNVGSYYHSDFLRGCEEKATNLGSGTGKGEEDDNADDDDAGNNDEEEEEEPDFYAMPPMPPLPKKEEERIPSPAERIVASALQEYGAFRTVRRALTGWIRRWRAGENGQGRPAEEAGAAAASLDDNEQHQQKQRRGTSHFLFQSILHSSLPVRRAAVRMILHNLHSVQQRTTTNHSRQDGGTDGGNDGGGLSEALTKNQ